MYRARAEGKPVMNGRARAEGKPVMNVQQEGYVEAVAGVPQGCDEDAKTPCSSEGVLGVA